MLFFTLTKSSSAALPGFFLPKRIEESDVITSEAALLRATDKSHEDHVVQGISLLPWVRNAGPDSPRFALRPLAERMQRWQERFSNIADSSAFKLLDLTAKVCDLGNACWTHKHFTGDIQTRQYRSPEVILGKHYDTSADIWSMACFVFELLTGDLLFDPKSGRQFNRDEDHLAQMIELLGKMPKAFTGCPRGTKEFFNRKGELKRIRNLKYWDLADVLKEKYRFRDAEAESLASFLLPMLRYDPTKRATAAVCLEHAWLETTEPN